MFTRVQIRPTVRPVVQVASPWTQRVTVSMMVYLSRSALWVPETISVDVVGRDAVIRFHAFDLLTLWNVPPICSFSRERNCWTLNVASLDGTITIGKAPGITHQGSRKLFSRSALILKRETTRVM